MVYAPYSSKGGLPPACNGCTCACHRQPGVYHCIPCCGYDFNKESAKPIPDNPVSEEP